MIGMSQSTSIPLCDLAALHAPVIGEVRAAIETVIQSQTFINGPQVGELEEKIAEYCGAAYAVGCSSGTDALLLSLMALDVGPGDEVITTPYTFFATVGAISRVGATPVFVDIESDTFNIDPRQVASAVTPRTKAIIPVHLFGQTAEMGPILEVASRHGLAVVEDAAQAIGAEYLGRRAGSMGTTGCFSFFPSKNLGCFGDGGMVVTNDPSLAEKMRVLRSHGARKKYHHELIGGNFRLDTIQAAAVLVKLKYLNQWNDARRARAATYVELLSHCAAEVALPIERDGCRHVYNQFVISSCHRNEIMAELSTQGIGTAVYYPAPLHLQSCFRDLGYTTGDFPISEQACNTSCALPMFPDLTAEQMSRVAVAVTETLLACPAS